MLAGLSLLTPRGLLVCLSALVPLILLALISRRQARTARAIGLTPARARAIAPMAAAIAAVCVALGVAASQPVLTTTATRSARTDSEIVFVVDVSRSMVASARPGGPTRLARARSAVRRMRLATPDVAAGIAGLTDRILPFLFPTLDAGAFSETLDRSVRVDAPPPQDVSVVATNFAPLSSIMRNGFFTPGVGNRTCVFVTDGETRSAVDGASLAGRRGCRLVVVRVGDQSDRIFTSKGNAESAYRPEASAPEAVARLARNAGGAAFDEDDLGGAVAAIRAAAESGPRAPIGSAGKSYALAPWFAALALALVLGIVAVRSRRAVLRRLQTQGVGHYHSRPDVPVRRAG